MKQGERFVCPRCGFDTDVLVCENNVSLRDGGGYRPRTDGCGNCIDKYNVYYRIPVAEALAD